MIWHFLEVWLLVTVAFVLGSGLGVLAYSGLARGRFAEAQGALADAVGDRIDGIKTRFGAEPAWRPGVKRAAARTSRENRQFRRDADFGGALRERFGGAPARAPRASTRRSIAYWEERERDVAVAPDGEAAREEEDGLIAGLAPDPADLEDLVEEVPDRPAAESLTPKADLPAMRPMGLSQPRNGIADNLQKIRGIGRRNEQLLHSLGIFHFGQIAAWTPAEARWVAAFLSFPERIERDDWIGQATILASGGDTGYVKRRDDDEDESG
jgi:predicted flap endonuclease-1-like 5' DNA nuclease